MSRKIKRVCHVPDGSDEINVHALKISQTVSGSFAYTYSARAVVIGGDGIGGGDDSVVIGASIVIVMKVSILSSLLMSELALC